MPFRPTLWPTLFTIPALIVLLGLGIWQVDRLHWKEGLIADRTARTTAAPIALPAAGTQLSPAALTDLDFRHGAATGTFLHERELYIAARTMEGSVGYQIVTPVATGGRQRRRSSTAAGCRRRARTRRNGPRARSPARSPVDGAIRAPGVQHWLQPDNQPAQNIWFWSDLPAMAAHAGIAPDKLVPVFLEAGPAPNPGGLPIGGQTKVNLPNDHLQYAITWFALAAGLAVIYVLYHRQRNEG